MLINAEMKKNIIMIAVGITIVGLLFCGAWLGAYTSCKRGGGDFQGWTCVEPDVVGYCKDIQNTLYLIDQASYEKLTTLDFINVSNISAE